MSGQDRPRHSRAEIRAFADELRKGGWSHEGQDANGHTIWSHPGATGTFKLPETPRHFGVQRARRDVARLLGKQIRGKRSSKVKPARQRQDFTIRAVQQQAASRPTPTAPPRDAPPRRAAAGRQLPWEDQPDTYNPGLARLMREIPGGR